MMKKRFLSIFLAFVLMFSTASNLLINANAASNVIINGVNIGVELGKQMQFTTSSGTKDEYGKYYNGYYLAGTECIGFARWCQYKLFGGHWYSAPGEFYNVKVNGVQSIARGSLTTSNLKAMIIACKPGAHLRTYAAEGSTWGHSMVITQITDTGFSIAQCNGVNNNEYSNWKHNYVGTYTYTWSSYVNSTYGKRGIEYIEMPYNYPYSNGQTTHSHSYSGSYYEAAHPHRVYQKCVSCTATKYTGTYQKVSSCAQCSFTQDSKYGGVKGFKAYPCVTSNFEVKTSDLTTRGGEIYTTDYCTINEVYTNGWCKVTFPMDGGGTRTAYTPISNFIKSPSATMTAYTASSYINLYSTSSLSTKIFRIYPNDACIIIGTSGSATQIFMPHTDGYYVLGWVATSDLNYTPSTAEKLNPGLTSLSSSSYAKCYTITNGRYNVYTSSSLSTRGYEGTASSTAWTGESDEIWIVGVGVNSSGTAYAKIKYPIGDSRYTAYVSLHSTLVPGSLTSSYRTAVAKVTGLSDRPGGTTNSSYWVDKGEKVYLLSQQNGYSQILYPTSSAWRIAWCTNTTYNSMFQAQTYTVTYNSNGGTGAPSSQTKTRDVDLTLSSTKPTRTGYTFVGWSTSSSATTAQYSAGSIYTNEASVTLYAVWRKQTFTITYNANGGTNAPGVQTQTYGTAITVTSEQPEKIYTVSFNANGGTVNTSYYSLDCTFASWNTNSSGTGTTVKSGASYTPNANTTLYAIYTNPTLGNYPIPSKTGYTFNGWYTAASGGTRVDATTVITANTTLYAQWSVETYSVTYFDDGSTNIPDEQTKIYGTALTLSSAIPVKDGYTFKGWATEEGSANVVYSPGSQYTNNEWVVLYAVWEKNLPTLSNIVIESKPTKTVYQMGEVFDSSGLKLKLIYSDGSTESIASGFTISGFSSDTVGTRSVYVSYGGITTKFTVDIEEPVITGAQYQITDVAGTAGSTVEVYVSIADNPGIISLRNTISYDTSALELVSVQDCGLLAGYTTPSATIASPYTLRWADSLAIVNNTTNGQLVKLTFKIKTGTDVGSYNISVIHVEARNVDGTKIVFSEDNATINVVDYSVGDPDCTIVGHSYVSKVTKAATCTTNGTKTYTCSNCSNSYTETIQATGHSWTAATCTLKKTCSTCGATDGSALGHSYSSKITNVATCTTNGTKTYTCSRCSDSYSETITATGHNWMAATCTSKKTCLTCGTTDGSVLGHSYAVKTTKEPTCTTSGTKVYACSRCSDSYTETISSTDHSYISTVVAPTCTEEGYTLKKCRNCDYSQKVDYTEAVGHNMGQWKITREETCTEDGEKSRRCLNCDYAQTQIIYASGHSMGSWKTTKQVTCTENGEKKNSCLNCDYYTTQTVYASGHSMSAWKTVKKATCTENGTKQSSCSECDYTEIKTINANGHSYVSEVTKDATCTTTGVETFSCSVCEDSYTKTIEKLGHKYSSSYTVDKKATCSAEGSKSKHCTRSGCTAKTSVTAIAKLAHTYDNNCDKTCNVCKATRSISHSYKNVTTNATLTKNGKVESKCSVCGYVSKTTTIYYPKTIKLSATSYTYNGKVKSPTVTVKDSKGNALKKDTDYTVSYASGRKNTGKYSVTVTFKGKYSGKKVLYFNILPSKTSKITPTCGTTSIKASWKKVTGASGYKVELLNSKGKVVKSATTTKTAYTFKSLSKVTTYKVRVTAYKTIDSKKVYSTSYSTITTSTAPAKVTLSKVSVGSKSATPTWKKVSGVSGYEVMYSTSSKFSSSKTATVSKGSSTKTTIKKLTKGKKYYFKVRAYKTVDGKKVYGAWSAVKSVKVK